jgi:hypothetical protein
MQFDVNDALEILARTPRAIDAQLRGTSPAWHAHAESAESWSALDVVGHLTHCDDTVWVARARILIEHGAARPFDLFDRAGHRARYPGWSLDRLLDRFAERRAESIEIVRGWHLDEEKLERTGRHPDLGEVTLRQLIATWSVHDLNHLAQIARVMAHRAIDDVGPWRAYLSVLKRATPA